MPNEVKRFLTESAVGMLEFDLIKSIIQDIAVIPDDRTAEVIKLKTELLSVVSDIREDFAMWTVRESRKNR